MFSKTIEGCIEVVLHLFPLPLALVVLEEIWIALGVVEEARGGDVFFAEGFGKRNGLASDGVRSGVGSGVPPTATFWPAIENEGDGCGLIPSVGVGGFVGEEIVEPFQGTEQFGAGIEVGWGALVAPIEVVAIGLGEAQCFPVAVVFD